MRIDFLTLFPDMCEAVMSASIIGRARKKGAVEIHCHQIRDFAYDKHNRVDDAPFGGGMGMLLMAEPIALCIDDLIEKLGEKPHLIYMSPQGQTLTQQRVRELAEYPNLALLCGHYEGIDERIIDRYVDEEISIGARSGGFSLPYDRRGAFERGMFSGRKPFPFASGVPAVYPAGCLERNENTGGTCYRAS